MRTRTISAKAQELVQELEDYSYNGGRIPVHMHEALACYIADHCPTGDFLTALLSGDLFDAIHRADDKNIQVLPVYAGFLYNHAPSNCYGSREKVKAWLAQAEGGES